MNLSASTTRRAAANVSATASSAVVSVSTPETPQNPFTSLLRLLSDIHSSRCHIMQCNVQPVARRRHKARLGYCQQRCHALLLPWHRHCYIPRRSCCTQCHPMHAALQRGSRPSPGHVAQDQEGTTLICRSNKNHLRNVSTKSTPQSTDQ